MRRWGAILVLALLAFRGSALQYTGTQYVPEGSAKMQRGAKLSQFSALALTWPTIAGFCNVCPINYEPFLPSFISRNGFEKHDSSI